MMKKIYYSLLFFSYLLSNLQAQQIGIYSHEFYKPMISNPAFTGNDEYLNAMLISRSQWINFRNSPQQNLFTLDGMLPNKKMALGISLFSDKKGISNKIGGDIYYAYQLKVNENTKLKFGIALGIIDHTLHYSEATIEDPSDPFIIGATQKETSINGNAGIGFVWKKLEIGVSVPQLLGNALEYQDNVSGKAYYSLTRHYQGSLKYKFILSENKQISLTPLAVLHFLPNAPIQYNANLNLDWKDKFWIGATYKSDYAVSANVGFCISKKFYVGYSYDFVIGNVGQYSGMSHEVMLNYVFGKSKPTTNETQEEAVTPVVSKDKTDSLQTELEIKNDKIKAQQERVEQLKEDVERLRKENEELKKLPIQTKAPIQTSDSTKKISTQNVAISNNKEIVNNNKETTINNSENARTKSDEYRYLNNKLAKQGYYVIMGAFLNENLAQSELKRIKSEGYSKAKIIYSLSKQLHYITISSHSQKEDAVKQVNKIKNDGINDVWILSVNEK